MRSLMRAEITAARPFQRETAAPRIDDRECEAQALLELVDG
jgi:hypothetical protein